MKKKLFAALAALSVCALVSACAAPLPDGFDEAEVVAVARAVVEELSAGDYAAVEARYSAKMTDTVAAGALEEALQTYFDALGEFKEHKKYGVGGGTDETEGEYAVVQTVAAYENGTATFTVSITKDGRVCGLYMK